MKISQGFLDRINSAAPGQMNDQARGAFIKFASMSKDIEEILGKLSEGSLTEFVERLKDFDKSSIVSANSAKELLTQIGKKSKLDDESIRKGKQLIDLHVKENLLQKKTFDQSTKYFQDRTRYFENERKMLQTQMQMQRDAVESWEKNFWGPFRNMFKGSSLTHFSQMAANTLVKSSAPLFSNYLNLTQRSYETFLSRSGDQLTAVFANAGNEYAKEFMNTAKEVFNALREGFKEGKEKSFQRKQEKIFARFEKSIEHAEHNIEHARNMEDLLDSKMSHTFSDFDDSVDLFGKYLKKALSIEGEKLDNIKKEKNNLDKEASISRSDGVRAKAGGFGSGIATGVMTALPYIGQLFGNAIGKMSETSSMIMDVLTEREKGKMNMGAKLQQQFGGISEGGINSLAGQRNVLFGLDFEQLQENYSALYNVYGNINKVSSDTLNYQIKFNKAIGIGAEEGAEFEKALSHAGFAGSKAMDDFRKQSDKFARKEGASTKDVMRDIVKNTNYIALVSSPKMIASFAKAAAELRGMGLHIDSIVKISEGFEDINNAIDTTFQLNAGLGTSMDPIRMHILAMQGDVGAVQKELFSQFKNIDELNVMQVRLISQRLGMSAEEVRTMHHALHLQHEMEDSASEMAQVQKQLLKDKSVTNRLSEAGFKTETEQQEFISKRIADLYDQHKADYKNFETFKEALAKPGSSLFKEFQVKLSRTDTEKTMEEMLQEQVDLEGRMTEKMEAFADGHSETAKRLIAMQQIISGATTQLLAWSIGIATPLMSGMLRALGAPKLAGAIDDMSADFGKMLGEFEKLQTDNPLLKKVLGDQTQNFSQEIKTEMTELWKNLPERIGNAVAAALKGVGTNFGDSMSDQLRYMPGIGTGFGQLWDMLSDREGRTFRTNANVKVYSGFETPEEKNRRQIEELTRPPKKKDGGLLNGPGGSRDDRIPLLASNGEYIINANAVQEYGVPFFDYINAKKYADGGKVSPQNSKAAKPHIFENDVAKQVILPDGSRRWFLKFDNGVFEVDENTYSNTLRNREKNELKSGKGTKQGIVLNEIRDALSGNLKETGKLYQINQGESLAYQMALAPLTYTLGKFMAIPNLLAQGSDVMFGSHLHNITRKPFEFINELTGANIEGNSSFVNDAADFLGSMKGSYNAFKKTEHLVGNLVKNKKLQGIIAANILGSPHSIHRGEDGGLSVDPANILLETGAGFLGATKTNISKILPENIKSELSHGLRSFIKEKLAYSTMKTVKKAVGIGSHERAASFSPEYDFSLSDFAENLKSSFAPQIEGHKNGGLVGSFKTGTLAGSLPGFINTNYLDSAVIHPNEYMQVLTQQQKTERDETFIGMTNVIKDLKKTLDVLTSVMGSKQNIVVKIGDTELKEQIIQTLYNSGLE